jgi:DNA-binding NtrC family response regulator
LVQHFLDELGDGEAFERIPAESIERLMRHDWPGNVRELKNAVSVAHALSAPGSAVDVAAHVGMAGGAVGSRSLTAAVLPYHSAKHDALARFEREYFESLVRLAPASISDMARRAGLQRAHVRRYLVRHGLLAPRFRTGDD